MQELQSAKPLPLGGRADCNRTPPGGVSERAEPMARIFQDSRQKKKLGEKKCPWSVEWRNAEGKPRSKKVGSKSMAEKFRRKVEGQQAAGLL